MYITVFKYNKSIFLKIQAEVLALQCKRFLWTPALDLIILLEIGIEQLRIWFNWHEKVICIVMTNIIGTEPISKKIVI